MLKVRQSIGQISLAGFMLVGTAALQYAFADVPSVVVSIKPIHSLVAGVMDGVGEPRLLLDGTESPHAYSLVPSEAAMLNDADIVFWIGEGLEAFLERPLEALAADAQRVAISDIEGLELLEIREGGVWEDHDDQSDLVDHDADGDHAEHDHGSWDPHLWLDPENAAIIVDQVAEILAEIDPTNADRYLANAAMVRQELDLMSAEITERLAPINDRPFIVFHDAYQYFERRFDLTPAGSITLSPDRQPGAQRLITLRDRLDQADVACLFTEPQFEPRLIATLAEGRDIRIAELDPIGAALPPGPNLYETLLTGMADAIAGCLVESS